MWQIASLIGNERSAFSRRGSKNFEPAAVMSSHQSIILKIVIIINIIETRRRRYEITDDNTTAYCV